MENEKTNPSDNIDQGSDVGAALAYAMDNQRPEVLKIAGPEERESIDVAVVDGKLVSVKPLVDEYRSRPERKAGTARMEDLGSFIDYSKRHANPDSVIFATCLGLPRLVTVLDAHGPAFKPAEFQRHRVEFAFPLSPEFVAWKEASGKTKSQVEFAAFLEEHVGDVIAPDTISPENKAELALRSYDATGPNKLLGLATELVIHEGNKVKSSADLAGGKAGIIFETEHTDSAGQRVAIPKAFAICVAPFVGGEAWEILVFLRYRVREGRVTWALELQRVDRVLRDAVEDAAKKAQAGTGLPLFRGSPEA